MGLTELINELELIVRNGSIDDFKIVISDGFNESEFIDIEVIDKKIIIEGL